MQGITGMSFPIYVHGPTSTGKTRILKHFQTWNNQRFPNQCAYITCETAFSPKLVFSKLLKQWFPHQLIPRCESIASFLEAIQDMIPISDKAARILVICSSDFSFYVPVGLNSSVI
jgi:Cdc6-like AAA superfamily ATPase